MSSRPGTRLEDFILWNYNITADGQGDANFSRGLAEVIGAIGRRQHLGAQQFVDIVAMFEEHRAAVEERLLDFDEASQSWRDYAGYAFSFVPDSLLDSARLKITRRYTWAEYQAANKQALDEIAAMMGGTR